MAISRRELLRHIGAGAAATAALPGVARGASLDRGGEFRDPNGRDTDGPVRLHENVNAYGPSPHVIGAIREATLSLAGRYPDTADEALRRKLAVFHRVTPEQAVLGCGSGDLLSMAAAAFLNSQRRIVLAQPTCSLMSELARRAGADVLAVPLRSDYSHDLAAMSSHASTATGLVYICNPNNPTGSLTRRRDLEAFIASLPSTVYVVIDEAYHHYVGGTSEYASFIDRPLDDPRLIVTRTFSAVYGLAGLRIGYAIAAPSTAALLAASGLTNNVSSIAAVAATAALDDTEHVRASSRRNADDRQELCNQANARMLRTIDSHANFVLLNIGRPAIDTIEHFRRHGVLVAGPFARFDTHIRVSLGTPAEMHEFWRVWDLLPPNHTMTM